MRNLRPWKIPAQQVEEERRDQRPVHYQAGIAFGFYSVAAVVMDAVPVESER